MKTKIILALLMFSGIANAGSITGGDLLDQTGANQLETWLGLGDLDFTNISNLSTGASAAQWHADVHGYTNVISIYDVTYLGNDYLIGGYSAIGHDVSGWHSSDDNFIFNLTIGKYAGVATDLSTGQHAQYDYFDYFPIFGDGSDLYGGIYHIGDYSGSTWDSQYGGDLGMSYHKGTTDMFGDPADTIRYFTVNGLESYVFTDASPVPVPAAVWLFGSGILGLFGLSKRNKFA